MNMAGITGQPAYQSKDTAPLPAQPHLHRMGQCLALYLPPHLSHVCTAWGRASLTLSGNIHMMRLFFHSFSSSNRRSRSALGILLRGAQDANHWLSLLQENMHSHQGVRMGSRHVSQDMGMTTPGIIPEPTFSRQIRDIKRI